MVGTFGEKLSAGLADLGLSAGGAGIYVIASDICSWIMGVFVMCMNRLHMYIVIWCHSVSIVWFGMVLSV